MYTHMYMFPLIRVEPVTAWHLKPGSESASEIEWLESTLLISFLAMQEFSDKEPSCMTNC